MRNAVRTLLIAYLVLVAGCVNWRQSEVVNTATVHKIETELASAFCYSGDMGAVRHEAGGHCMGQDH